MSVERVREYFKSRGIEDRLQIQETTCATVPEAAETLGVEPGRICKTLSFRDKNTETFMLIQMAGDVKVNSGMFKRQFGFKATMLTAEEVIEHTGHEIGGVCAFGIADPEMKVYCDRSMLRFETVFPACGGEFAMAEFTTDELFEYSNASDWIEVCKLPVE